ncbi:hypothetical protein CAPTEDRAFT_212826 [Capitella teleta]|uniref:Uncharacterized protein n=1 Tax=Capitella teleta TaxID=283909 RepID=R7VAE0_CAPTE|nr:hypothetical protein CAPTEDRAFT_212826 [Capitella teleta]|eukprot:ELU15507.1 hypothetical protein CAPTEDRAFT_212826 [Capitella teleta]
MDLNISLNTILATHFNQLCDELQATQRRLQWNTVCMEVEKLGMLVELREEEMRHQKQEFVYRALLVEERRLVVRVWKNSKKDIAIARAENKHLKERYNELRMAMNGQESPEKCCDVPGLSIDERTPSSSGTT